MIGIRRKTNVRRTAGRFSFASALGMVVGLILIPDRAIAQDLLRDGVHDTRPQPERVE